MPDRDISIYASLLKKYFDDYKNERNATNTYKIWVKISIAINHTNVIWNGKYITYSVLFQFCPPKVRLVLFASNLIRMPKMRRLR